MSLRVGSHEDLDGANLLIVTAGVNEATGGATNRSDPAGRLRLLDRNAVIYHQLIPALVSAAPQATIMCAGHSRSPGR